MNFKKNNPKQNKVLFLLAAILVALFLLACIPYFVGGLGDHTGQARTPSGSSAQKGRDYHSVVKDFEKKGFTNIKTEQIDDLVFGWLTKDGEVEKVYVDGDPEYSSDEWYPADVEVIISYHTFSASETPIPSHSPTAENMANIEPTNEILNDSTLVTEQPAIDLEDKSNKNNGLREYQAHKAFEYYGEHMYPYGFDCHWYSGLRASEQLDDGSWFFIVEVTITNQYGASREMIAEALINNTTQSVEQFRVYQE